MKSEKGSGWGNSVTLVSCSKQTTALPESLRSIHTPISDSIAARDEVCSKERERTTPSLHCTIASLQRLVIGREGTVKKKTFAGDSLRTFGSQRVSTKVPCQPIKDVKLASWVY